MCWLFFFVPRWDQPVTASSVNEMLLDNYKLEITILPAIGDKSNISGRRHRWAGSATPKEGGWGKERE